MQTVICLRTGMIGEVSDESRRRIGATVGTAMVVAGDCGPFTRLSEHWASAGDYARRLGSPREAASVLKELEWATWGRCDKCNRLMPTDHGSCIFCGFPAKTECGII